MTDMDKKQKPRIDLMEGYFLLSFNFIADIVELIAVALFAIPFVGQAFWAAKIFISFGVWALTQLWLIIKGIRGEWYAAGSLLDFIINLAGFDLPFAKSITFAFNWYLINKKPSIVKVIPKTKLSRVVK